MRERRSLLISIAYLSIRASAFLARSLRGFLFLPAMNREKRANCYVGRTLPTVAKTKENHFAVFHFSTFAFASFLLYFKLFIHHQRVLKYHIISSLPFTKSVETFPERSSADFVSNMNISCEGKEIKSAENLYDTFVRQTSHSYSLQQ